MNGDPNQTPSAGWQFKPDAAPDAATANTPAAPAVASEAPLTPTIASDTPKATDTPIEPPRQLEPTETPPISVPTGIDIDHDRPESADIAGTRQDGEPLRWSVAEAPHGKPSGWMTMLVGGTFLVAAAVYALTRDFVNAGAVIAAGLLLGAYNARRPQTVQYQLDNGGIVIGQKRYPYALFRSFALEDGGQHGLVLMPLKRFMPVLSMHYPAELEDDVLEVLSDRLPMEALRRDAMDAISRKLKF